MGKITFDEEKHEYRWDGIKVPSVSDILAPLSAERYSDINPAVLAQAAARGTAVHEMCEAMDYGLEPEIEPGLEGYAQAYADFLRDYFPKWDMVEQTVAYRRIFEEKPYYCGTVDRFGAIDGKHCVLDIKSYASLTTDGMVSASCQTSLYRSAIYSDSDTNPDKIRELVRTKRYLLHLKKDGNYRLVDLDKFDLERGFNSGSVAWSLCELWHDLDNARNWKKGKK